MTGWVRVGGTADVPLLEGRSVALGDRRVAIFRLHDRWAAVDARCPHRDGPLQDGIVADDCVTCPLHNFRFSLTTGEQVGGDEAIAVHEVAVRDGDLYVRLSDAEARAA